MLRAYRFRPSALLRGVSQGRQFDPVTLQKTSLELDSFDVNRRGVTGFLLYSKMLAKIGSLLLLISKNKGVYPVTIGVFSVIKSRLEQTYEGVTGYIFDPVTGGKSKMKPDDTRYPNTRSKDRFFNRKLSSGTHLVGKSSQRLLNKIFNKSILMLKIWNWGVKLATAQTQKTQTETGKARFREFYSEMHKVKRYWLKAGHLFNLGS